MDKWTHKINSFCVSEEDFEFLQKLSDEDHRRGIANTIRIIIGEKRQKEEKDKQRIENN